ncbi:NUDIX hydrolase [Kibdelosporangium phytohabitans]|uniref:NUDIX hydrolase n=1 Tax=Kibdelosporangium phytohabitans TaxID=860235 RepID=A0A0N9HV83_9PSEU|nr:CoA pyrophosphatase [Kibdelosporangium phytohabitans]ALG05810.1 NUDIX hydrolase [Kibdelosporangium phytohabitans]MBE1466173.1 8-oxo-dGTP pyrophosphatase MutT (NUDIX family) [Kibdelosporangium phytohabitans]
MTHGPLVDPADVPNWMAKLVGATGELDAEMFRRLAPPDHVIARPAAVLILLGEGPNGPDVLLTRRSDDLGSHPGQVAFPGGKVDEGDDFPVGTAMREAVEETGVLPSGVRPVAVMPELYVPVSKFLVTPVVAHWQTPSPVRAVDLAETAAVARIPLDHLADPANRFMVRHPSGFTGPAFSAPGMLVWGFTAGLLTVVLAIGGWEVPWDTTDVRELDVAWRSSRPEE